MNLKKVAEIDQKKTNHLQCNVCNQPFTTLVKFAIHCLKNHFNSIFYQYDCGFCYEVHSSKESFLAHVISQAADKDNSVAIVCPLCVLPQGPSSSEEQFCEHLRQQHVDLTLEEWVCMLPSCGYVAYDIGDYAKHIIAAHTNQTVANAICQLCKSPKTSSGYLKRPTVTTEQLQSYVEEVHRLHTIQSFFSLTRTCPYRKSKIFFVKIGANFLNYKAVEIWNHIFF